MKHKLDRSSFEYLQATVYGMVPDVTEHVFQANATRLQAESCLRLHPGIPFIIRNSRVRGYFAIDYQNKTNPNLFFHTLIKPPACNETEFTLWRMDDDQFSQINKSLQFKLDEIWLSNLSLSRTLGKQLRLRWEQFKKGQELLVPKRAVFSLQSLDNKKVAFSPEEVVQYSELHKNSLGGPGDGHTGLTMALVLKEAPFVVIRSKGNRIDSSKALENHIGNNGIIVITGHSSAAAEAVSGTYVNDDDEFEFRNQVLRGTEDITSFSLESGLQKGDHVVILLCICYGAKSIHIFNNSFAHKLAREFANNGINSTIIASDKLVGRFGTDAIKDGQLEFTGSIGMYPDSVNVLFTNAENGQTFIFKPHDKIFLDQNGLHFVSPVPELFSDNVLAVSQSQNTPGSSGEYTVDEQPLNAKQNTSSKQSPLINLSLLAGKRISAKPDCTMNIQDFIRLGLSLIKGTKGVTNYKKALLSFQQASMLGSSSAYKNISGLNRVIRVDRKKFTSIFRRIEEMGLYADLLIQTNHEKGDEVKSLAVTLDDRLTNFLLFCRYNPISQLLLQQFKSAYEVLLKSRDNEMLEYGEDWRRIVANSLLALTGLSVLIIMVFSSKSNSSMSQDNLEQLFFSTQSSPIQSMEPIDVSSNEVINLSYL